MASTMISHVADYAASRVREPGTVPELAGIDKEAAAAAIRAFLASHPQGGWLDGPALDAVVSSYGLPVAPSTVVHERRGRRRGQVRVQPPRLISCSGGTIGFAVRDFAPCTRN
jgi:hypothetical protein